MNNISRLLFFLIITQLLLISCNKKDDNTVVSPQISEVQYIVIGDVNMAYRTVGVGYPLLLCMGFTGVMDIWPEVVLYELANHYKVIIFENRGMGYSTIINDTTAFSMKLFAQDAANLMNALDISIAHVMAWSMGTYIAQELALNYPEKVNKVILYAADCGDDITIQPDSAVMAILSDPNASDTVILSVLFPENWLERPDALAYFPQDFPEADSNIVKRQDIACRNWFTEGGGTTDRLGSFNKQTLLITGDQDICTPWKNTLIMKPLIENSEILILPGGGHGLMYQYPYDFSNHVLTFLKEDKGKPLNQ
ncbi:MAG TPA: alpha/beta hydrolase [Bacteroidales bacterium]|jgi:pimeloyl-ACP methyl ester carboxylesterase|nr:alpha/beta hydrolase [Bacteroidota bacterium]HJN05716.1 alpha/beta hydrolase [Bacteroidales bacterium]